MEKTLPDIIEEAYTLFSGYEAVRPLDICTHCCMSFENEALLARLPVREIPLELLMEYNDGAATEKTPTNEMKHFLPRYMQLISTFDFPSHSAEIALKRLSPFDKTEWSDEELALLHTFSLAFFEKCLSTYPLPIRDEMDSILILFWRGSIPIAPLLSAWEQNDSPSSILHLKDFCWDGFMSSKSGKLTNGFADAELSAILRNWLDQEDVRKRFMKKIETMYMLSHHGLEEIELIELDVLYGMFERGII